MSDYLGTLVARSTDHVGSLAARDDAGTIRPRLPSLFEPPAAPPIDEMTETIPATSAISERGLRRVSRPVSPPRGETGQTGDLASRVATDQPSDDRGAPIEITASGVQMAEPGVSDQRDEGDRAGATLASSIESQSVAEPRVSEDRSGKVPPGGHPTERLDEIVGSSTTAIDVHVIESVRPSFRQTGTPLPTFPATDRSELRPPHRAERVRMPGRAGGRARAADQPAPDLAEPAVAESPAIHVTIGRVEIRAAMPPAAQTKRPSARSGLSLDEYLGKPARGDR